MSNINIESIIRENKIFALTSELDDTVDENRQMQLEAMINNLQGECVEKKTSMETFNDHLDKVDELMYKRTWGRLQSFQKEEKIKEYVNNKFPNDPNCNLFVKQLIEGYTDLKTKDIVYDSKSGKIIEVVNFEFKAPEEPKVEKIPNKKTKIKTESTGKKPKKEKQDTEAKSEPKKRIKKSK